jgi:hypothetical protein
MAGMVELRLPRPHEGTQLPASQRLNSTKHFVSSSPAAYDMEDVIRDPIFELFE